MSNMQTICRAIAGFDDWKRAGVRVVDPETGASYRRLPNAWVNESDHSTNGITGNQSPSCVRAIAAGPDANDSATLGVLFDHVPMHVNAYRGSAVLTMRWEKQATVPPIDQFILRAYAAAKGVQV